MRKAVLLLLLLPVSALGNTLTGHIRLVTAPPGLIVPPDFQPELFLDATLTMEPTTEPIWASGLGMFVDPPEGTHRITALEGITINGQSAHLVEVYPGFPWVWLFGPAPFPLSWRSGIVTWTCGTSVCSASRGREIEGAIDNQYFSHLSGEITNIQPVPEPASAILLLVGLACCTRRVIQTNNRNRLVCDPHPQDRSVNYNSKRASEV